MIAEEASLCARQRGFHRGWLSSPRVKGEYEASEDEQADSSSENNVGDGALFVNGLHGSGDAIAHILQDSEVAKVALSCHDMLCQEFYEVANLCRERRHASLLRHVWPRAFR